MTPAEIEQLALRAEHIAARQLSKATADPMAQTESAVLMLAADELRQWAEAKHRLEALKPTAYSPEKHQASRNQEAP